MSDAWDTVTLGEIADEITVGHVGSMAGEYKDSGIPFLRSLNIEPFKLKMNDLKFIDSYFHNRLRKSALSPGDVLIVRTGKPGSCAVVPDWLAEANCSDLVIVRCGDRVRPHFLSYVVNSLAGHHIDSHTVGAVQQHFNVGSARTLRLNLPPLAIQDSVLEVLRAHDDKIELNRRMNETLEASARALFRDWFVDFGPTRAKTEGRPAYLASDLWSLFPDRLDDDGVPEGWQPAALTQMFDIVGGGTPKTSRAEFWNGAIPWFSVVDTPPAGSVFVLDTEKTITRAGLDGSSARLIDEGTTIISARGTVGNLAMAATPMTFNQSCYALVGRRMVGPAFVYLVAQDMVERLKAMAHGSVFATITRDTFEKVLLPFPRDAALAAFESEASLMFDRIKANVI